MSRARIDAATTRLWRRYATEHLARYGRTPEDVTAGVDAWNIAHRIGMVLDMYRTDPDINDAHIQTALRRIFPNATFGM
jgi:hypothetical protein